MARIRSYTVVAFDSQTRERLAKSGDEYAQSFVVRAATPHDAAFKGATKVFGQPCNVDIHVFEPEYGRQWDFQIRTTLIASTV